MTETFALLVPVKTLHLAKSRLATPLARHRAELMRAFALDALAAAGRSEAVRWLYVVTDEPGFDGHDALRLPDEGDGDLNRALAKAAARVRREHPGTAVAAMCADLPCLATDDLTTALVSPGGTRWFVADAAGTGTTLLAAGAGAQLDPRFGPLSAPAHEASGAVPLRAEVATLRRDVDTEDDLADARALGLGPASTQALAVL